MRFASIAGAIVFVFIGAMYLRFSGDAVPSAAPTSSPRTTSIVVNEPGRLPPTDSSTPMPERVPAFLEGYDIVPLQIGSPFEIPADAGLILETGCWGGCEAPPDGLIRVYRDPSGAYRTDPLFRVEQLGLPPRSGHEPAYVEQFIMLPDASEILVRICTRGACSNPYAEGSPDAESKVFRSTDGGVTWNEFSTLSQDEHVIGILDEGLMLVAQQDDKTGGLNYYVLPERSTIAPPSGVGQAWPQVLAAGEVVWHVQQEGLLLDNSGAQLLAGGPNLTPDSLASLDRVFGTLDGSRVLAGITQYQRSGGATYYFVELPLGPDARTFSTPTLLFLGVWPEPDTLFGSADANIYTGLSVAEAPGSIPTVIDFQNGWIRPITQPFADEGFPRGRHHVVAVQQGPFGRVVNTEGTCLNIRAAPGSGGVLDCAAEGVLLRDLAETADVGGVPWIRVRTPAGIEGWASTQYLEY